MKENLPITISVHTDLASQFNKITSVGNKLEAQFNFHTLMANWYGDEEKTLLIQLALETPVSFSQCQISLDNHAIDGVKVNHFSDDVISRFNKNDQQILCNVAITESEIELLTSQPKLIAMYLEKKLHKVLNLIAQEQSLPSI